MNAAKGETSCFKQAYIKKKIKMNLYDIHTPVVESTVGPDTYFNPEPDTSSQNLQASAPTLSQYKSKHRYLKSLDHVPGNIAYKMDSQKDTLTANFQPQDQDRFGVQYHSK